MKRFFLTAPAFFALGALMAGTLMMASADSHDQTYYACLYAGSLSQVNTNAEPANCGRGVPISWNAEGVQGEQGEQGPPGLVWQGDWAADFNDSQGYAQDDAVHHEGSAWISLVDDNTEEPGEAAANWDLLAAQGEQGPPGAPGDSGGSDVNIYEVTGTPVNYPANSNGPTAQFAATAACDEGDLALGGGYLLHAQGDTGTPRFFNFLSQNGPDASFSSWNVRVAQASSAASGTLVAYVTCLEVEDDE